MTATQTEINYQYSREERVEIHDPITLRLAAFLKLHCLGKSNQMTAGQIAERLKIGGRDGRAVRELISINYSKFPFVLCGAGGGGYYIATCPEEIEHEYRSIFSRFQCLLVRLKGIKQTARRSGYQITGKGPRIRFTKESHAQ